MRISKQFLWGDGEGGGEKIMLIVCHGYDIPIGYQGCDKPMVYHVSSNTYDMPIEYQGYDKLVAYHVNNITH